MPVDEPARPAMNEPFRWPFKWQPLALHFGSPRFGYALAVAMTALAGIGQLEVFEGNLTRAPFVLFYPAIAATAYLAGLAPSLACIILAAFFSLYFFPFHITPGTLIPLPILGTLGAILFVRIRQTRDIAVATSQELARFKFIGDHASDWIFLLGATGEIQYVNRTACTHLGYPEPELIGRPLRDIVSEAQRTELQDLLARVLSGPVHPIEIAFNRNDGTPLLMELICTAVRTDTDQVIHAAARDITERRQMEQRLRDMRNWESLGVMAGGMAHDFNNLLMSIIGNASLAKDLLPPNHQSATMIDGVIAAGERSADLVRLMLAVSGHRNHENEILDLSRALSSTLSGRSLPEKVRVTVNAEPVTITADHRSIQTLLWSLISNAAESYGGEPGEVNVTIRAQNEATDAKPDFEDGQCDSPNCVTITVEDHGCGMTPEVRERAFDPFFSTKFTGRGLGLPAARGLVRAYTGRLRLFTAPGEGTKVEIMLPANS